MKSITRKQLKSLPSPVLKNMVSVMLSSITFTTDVEKQQFLKKYGYTSDHQKWTDTRLIAFIMKFKPTIK